MDDCCPVGVHDDADLQWGSASGRPDEHDHVRIVSVEGSPVVSVGVVHVCVEDAVLAGACFDFH